MSWADREKSLAYDRARSKRKHAEPGKVTSVKHMGARATRRELEELAPIVRLADLIRPRTRAECIDGPRPCPWVSCRHHLYLEANPHKNNGSIKLNFPDIEPDGMVDRLESCSLDVAEDGPQGYERVGELMNLTRERVRQLEERVVAKLEKSVQLRRLAKEGEDR